MRASVRQLASICAYYLPSPDPIYEFGAYQVPVPGVEGWADLRQYYPGRDYIGADMLEGPGVDKVLNLHDIDLPDNSVGTILAYETLEHVEYPKRALEEIYRVLKPGGIAIVNSAMDFPIHDYPNDFWRYTPDAFKSLLKPFPNSYVAFCGRAEYPHTVYGIGFKGESAINGAFLEQIGIWEKIWEHETYLPPFVNYTTVLHDYEELSEKYKVEKESWVKEKAELTKYLAHVESEYKKSVNRIQEAETILGRPSVLLRHTVREVGKKVGLISSKK